MHDRLRCVTDIVDVMSEAAIGDVVAVLNHADVYFLGVSNLISASPGERYVPP